MGRSPIHWAVLAALWFKLLSLAAAISLHTEPLSQRESSFEHEVSTIQTRDTDKFLLRIMPLGASITMGYKSTDLNGYREHIRQQLRSEGWQVDMVGSKRNGTMHNNVCNPPKTHETKKDLTHSSTTKVTSVSESIRSRKLSKRPFQNNQI